MYRESIRHRVDNAGWKENQLIQHVKSQNRNRLQVTFREWTDGVPEKRKIGFQLFFSSTGEAATLNFEQLLREKILVQVRLPTEIQQKMVAVRAIFRSTAVFEVSRCSLSAPFWIVERASPASAAVDDA